MADQPRDWDRELAEIDKVMTRTGGQAGTAPVRGGGVAVPDAGGRMAAFTTWMRVVLGLFLAVGMTQWPYANACGLNLAVYLGAIAAVIVAGAWSGLSSWRRRLGLAHFLSLAVLLWGLVLAAREVLPRVGYAKSPRAWTCASGAVER
jgi:hypothetical protein